jgi:hypothetical protein
MELQNVTADRLQRALDVYREREHLWASNGHDCASFANALLRDLWGVDLMERAGVHYYGYAQALEIMGQLDPEQAADKLLGAAVERVPVRLSAVGDLVVIAGSKVASVPWFGVHAGQRVVVAADVGVAHVRLGRIVAAWRVAPCLPL